MNKIKNNQKSDKLVILCVSAEFFTSNFWTLPREVISQFDICCINYSILYMIKNRMLDKCNYLFSTDPLIIEFINDNLSQQLVESLFISIPDQIQNDIEILGFPHEKNPQKIGKTYKINPKFLCRNSGSMCLSIFMQYNLYKEIHLIGMNLVPESGAIYPGIKKQFSMKGLEHRKIRAQHPLNIEYVQKMTKYYNEKFNNSCTVYRTYDKSNLDFFPKSSIFFTDKSQNINPNHGFINNNEKMKFHSTEKIDVLYEKNNEKNINSKFQKL